MPGVTDALPGSVRYVKNGAGGQWWKAARDDGQIHAGWRNVPAPLLLAADMAAIESLIRAEFGAKPGQRRITTRCEPCSTGSASTYG